MLLVLDQIKNLLGLRAVGDAHDHFLYRFWLTLTQGGAHPRPDARRWASATIALVLGLRWLKHATRLAAAARVPDRRRRRWPRRAAVLGLDRQGVKVVGEIPATLPAFRLPVARRRADARALAHAALAIALLGLLEAISMAKAIAAVTRQKLDLNQQCLSEGLANLTGSFFQCMPGSGSLTRSAINQQAGAQTQWSGVVSAIAVAFIMIVVRALRAFHPALGAGRHPDARPRHAW